jgi:predicted aspartyl protease
LALGVYGLRRPDVAGRIVSLAAVGLAAASVIRPHLTAQFLTGAQPGVVVVAALIAGRVLRRRWLARRDRTWPAFTDESPAAKASPVPAGRSGATPSPIHSAGS